MQLSLEKLLIAIDLPIDGAGGLCGAAIRQQEKKGNPIYGTPIRARGTIGGDVLFGVPVRRADDAASLRRELDAAFAMDGPVVVEAIVDSTWGGEATKPITSISLPTCQKVTLCS